MRTRYKIRGQVLIDAKIISQIFEKGEKPSESNHLHGSFFIFPNEVYDLIKIEFLIVCVFRVWGELIAFIIMETEEASENTMSDIVEVVYNMDFKQMTIPNYYNDTFEMHELFWCGKC